MRIYIYTRIEYEWNGSAFIKTFEDGYEYDGPVARLCGATSGQKDIGNAQSAFYTQMTQQATQVFGQDSALYNQLVSTFAPTVAAGPNQQGFSPAELSAMNSQAITNTGQAYKNAKAAVGEAQAAYGGGNNPLPSGAQTGEDLQIATSAASQQANELNQIQQANYATGRQNYQFATQGLAGAGNVFNSATSLENAATGAGSAAANTQNQIAQANNSVWQGLEGLAGGIAGGVLSGGLSIGMGAAGAAAGGGYGTDYEQQSQGI